MPENVQGQFEKRLYLNTRIKSGGTYTTEGPHGLAFVEELNNYVTENQNTSITLGSLDHKVSILFDGPSTFVRDGIGISSSVPASTSNRLYNNNGDLYWNYHKLAPGTFIGEDAIDLYLGKQSDSDFCEYVIISADEVRINDSALAIGPNGIEITSNDSIIISGPYNTRISFDGEGIHLGSASNPCTTTIEGPSVFKNTLELDYLNSQPFDTNNKLYNYGGNLYWTSRKLADGTYITEDASGLYLGKSYDIAQCEFVNITADEVRINDSTLVIGPEIIKSEADQIYFGQEGLQATSVIFNGPVTFNSTAAFRGPINSGLQLDNNIPSSTTNRLYNNNGDLYWNGCELGYAFNYINEGINDLQLGKQSDSDYCDYVYITADEVKINDTRIVVGPSEISLNANEVKINDTSIVSGANEVSLNAYEVRINDTVVVAGPSDVRFYDSLIIVGPNGVTFNATTSFDGPVTFNGTAAFNGPIRSGLLLEDSIPSSTSNKLYNNNGDLYWSGTKLNGGGGSSYEHIVEVPDVLYFGWKGDAGTEIDHIETRGEYIETYFDTLSYQGYKGDASVTFDSIQSFIINGPGYSNLVIGPDGIEIASSEVKINGTAFVAGPNEIKIASSETITITANEVKINDTAFVVGPSDIRLGLSSFIIGPNNLITINGPRDTQLTFASDGIHLGSASNPCTTTIEGPSIFKNTLELDSLSSHPSYRTYKLYNNNGDLYWNGTKLNGGGGSSYIHDDAGGLYLGKLFNSDYCQYVDIKADEVKINGTEIVVGPQSTSINGTVFIVGPSYIMSDADVIEIGQATTTQFNGPVRMIYPLQLNHFSSLISGPYLGNYKGNLYWDHSKVTNSIIEVPYQDVADEPGKRGESLTLENNTIYNFDPDHDVDIIEINVKPWNTPQLHLYFNNTSSGKSKMTFTYPSEWKWINQSTPPSSSDFKEGYLYCIALRSVENPVYIQSSTTPPYNEQYIVIANIAYEVPIDV